MGKKKLPDKSEKILSGKILTATSIWATQDTKDSAVLCLVLNGSSNSKFNIENRSSGEYST